MKHIAKRLREDSEYQGFFLNALHKFNEKFGTKGIGDMGDEEKKEFFNYVDKNYKGKAEVIKEVDGPLTGTVNVVFSIQKDLPSTDTEFLKKHIAKILQNMFSRERGIKFEVERKYGEPQVNLQ
jgi:hypothetical protein